MARKPFWKPYADGVLRNDANTLMKAENLKCVPKFLLNVFANGPSYEKYLVESQIEGIARNVSWLKKTELPAIEVTNAEGKTGIYDHDLVKKVNNPGSKMYLPQNNGILLIQNKDGTCGIVACCLPDVFEAV